MRVLLLLAALLMSIGAFAANAMDDNKALNTNYQRFVEAFQSLDPEVLEKVYDENACYITDKQDREIVRGRQAIVAVYHAFFGKIKRKNARIEVDFRLLERTIEGNSATDVGYYLVRFHPAADTGEPVSEFAGKFVTVAKKQKDGAWSLTVDSNNGADSRFYFDAKPVPNLYYGEQFVRSLKP
ncbi:MULTISPECIES: YybH family protein [Shewanella]|uniref:Nuclear transport factor 2 family protein n=3 Tax=Shewanellaceae TaxID=267890 RepID=A0A974XWY3_9GAMM|nr:nuclear transport factor 2 family protein [Shewanella cyperi]QSX39051.1 nuclear transport factor 2 family protein [Shewanella sedimentimangrovi]QSX42607.1 nuclear transport factor 2 family protein [Shewanella cyperi]